VALDEQASAPGLWDDPDKAQTVMQQRRRALATIEGWEKPAKRLEDAEVLIAMAEEEGDEALAAEIQAELVAIEAAVADMEFRRMLSGESDASSAIMHINAGAGGREAQDWADMLVRMYLRWSEEHGFQTEMYDVVEGDDGGVKSATFAVDGAYAYGHLRAEAGVHRLVRISPFDAQARRHTSFASVFVYPQVDDDIAIDIDEGDLRIDTYRSSGAGGQHVNKTSSAIRITHLPTGIVVQCQNERSQHKNKAMAMKYLAARLKELELQKRADEKEQVEKSKMRIDFGSQIRSYVLAPYRLVKDHRTGFEMGNADAVLDGALDGFIKAYLLAIGEQGPSGAGPRSL
jgi:peptide chain release factor 2